MEHHPTWFKLTQGKVVYIVFMYASVEVGGLVDNQTNTSAKFPNEIDEGKQILAGSAQHNIL